MPDASFGWNVFTWAWSNRAEIAGYLGRLRVWFRGQTPADPGRGILIIGPGGAGKSTLARLLSGDFDWLLDEPWRYDQSYAVEHHRLRDDPKVSIVVPPGQLSRREATWGDVEQALAAGRYRGVILVSADGHHDLPVQSYKTHELYRGSKEEFLTAYLDAGRRDEVSVLERIAGFVGAASAKLWLLSVVAKEDLWWPDRQAVGPRYKTGAYAEAVGRLGTAKGPQAFRHELVSACLVISNFLTGEGEVLRKNAEGYDHRRQVESLRRLFEVVMALMDWEAAP